LADRQNPFVARLLDRSASLARQADVAIEEARHLRLSNRRLRADPDPLAVDEFTTAKLRKFFDPPRSR
jgi:hypothetical protein